VAKKHMGDWHAAIAYLEEAYNISNRFPDRAFAEEYLDLLINNGRFQKAWEVYLQLPLSISQGDRILIIVGRAALELEKYDFLDNLFNLEFAVLREGEMLIVELWYLYRAKMLAKERKVEFTEELVKEVMGKFSPPDNIDFRLNV
jgi:tetratricopeptide (TPR) repeat protein